MPDLRVLFTREQIARRVRQIGQKITMDFAGEQVLLVGVLRARPCF